MAYYLGIDGGGSKTICAVADDSAILATATAGPSNVVRVGEALARESLHACVKQACAAAKIDLKQISYICIGVAGAARAEVASVVRNILAEILSSPIEVIGDMQIALEAAFGGGPGVIVIAGTGSIAYGRNAQGTTARAGGLGAATSDEGSGHWIGKRALVLAIETQTKDGLLTAIQQAWDAGSRDELKRMASSEPAPNFALLFPVVLAAADSGNVLACAVLAQAGEELAKLAFEVVTQLVSPTGANAGQSAVRNEPGSVLVAMVGGVFRHAQTVREVFYNRIRELDARVEVRQQVVDPIDGAVSIARKATRR